MRLLSVLQVSIVRRDHRFAVHVYSGRSALVHPCQVVEAFVCNRVAVFHRLIKPVETRTRPKDTARPLAISEPCCLNRVESHYFAVSTDEVIIPCFCASRTSPPSMTTASILLIIGPSPPIHAPEILSDSSRTIKLIKL